MLYYIIHTQFKLDQKNVHEHALIVIMQWSYFSLAH